MNIYIPKKTINTKPALNDTRRKARTIKITQQLSSHKSINTNNNNINETIYNN